MLACAPSTRRTSSLSLSLSLSLPLSLTRRGLMYARSHHCARALWTALREHSCRGPFRMHAHLPRVGPAEGLHQFLMGAWLKQFHCSPQGWICQIHHSAQSSALTAIYVMVQSFIFIAPSLVALSFFLSSKAPLRVKFAKYPSVSCCTLTLEPSTV